MAAPKENKYAVGNDGGRPPLFKDANTLKSAIDEYFEIEPQVTITGLALHLGFESRQSLYDYEKDEVFSYIIKKARLQVENEYEKKLSGNNVAGAVFALKNMGWRDKQELEHTGNMQINWHEEKNYAAEHKAD